MLVKPNGAKYWRLKYRLGGPEQAYAIGVYPEVSLAEARRERDQARQWIRKGLNPTIQRRASKAQTMADQSLTFEAAANEWYAEHAPGWSAQYQQAQRSRLDNEILPHLGALPMKNAGPVHVSSVLERIHKRGAHDVLAKCRVLMSHVFRHAVVPAGLQSNPVDVLKGRFPRHTAVVNRRTIKSKEMPRLFKALHEVPGEHVTKLALYFVILTVSRTNETRFCPWSEIEEHKGGWLWRIPEGPRMKMKDGHVQPLSRLAVEILKRAKALRTSPDDPNALVFPGFTRVGHGGLSENALLAMLARSGHYGRQTVHGFRGAFSTWAHEVAEAPIDVIEACLAHKVPGVRGIYNRSLYIPQRRKLLEAWADQCVRWGLHLP